MSGRETLIDSFLAAGPWKSAERLPLNQDASFRRYWRLRDRTRTAMLMDAPPPEKSVSLFADIARFLRDKGLYAPEIYAIDEQNGLMLIEDFGDATFTRILEFSPAEENALYELAVDTLITLHQIDSYQDLSLPAYDAATLRTEANLFIEWFYPALVGRDATSQQIQQFEEAWQECLRALTPHQPVLVLRDYHVDNLMRIALPGQSPRCGLLDFQDALMGSPAYDLMSLIEDARRDLSVELKNRCLQRYFSGMAGRPDFPVQEALLPWLNVLAAQRHSKVLGIFVRLCRRDNKTNYLEHLPRVLALYTGALEREPILNPVSQWMAQHLPQTNIILDKIKAC